MIFKTESKFQKTLVEQALDQGIRLIVINKVFDLELKSKTRSRFIELKIIQHDLDKIPNVGDKYGFKFTKNQTRVVKRTKNKARLPFVIAHDNKTKSKKSFYFITGEKLEKASHYGYRNEYPYFIFNRVERNHIFKKPITWEKVLQELKTLSEYCTA